MFDVARRAHLKLSLDDNLRQAGELFLLADEGGGCQSPRMVSPGAISG